MAATQSTIEISKLKDEANKTLRDSHDDMQQFRAGLQIFIERILMDTGNYKGYRHLDKNDMLKSACGTTFAINIDVEGKDGDLVDARFKDTDHTRVEYY